jgi:hypothetical protein
LRRRGLAALYDLPKLFFGFLRQELLAPAQAVHLNFQIGDIG